MWQLEVYNLADVRPSGKQMHPLPLNVVVGQIPGVYSQPRHRWIEWIDGGAYSYYLTGDRTLMTTLRVK